MTVWTALGLLVLALFAPRLAEAQYRPGPPRHGPDKATLADTVPEQLDGIGIVDKTGEDVPRDVELIGSDGRSFVVGEYMDGDKPLVLVLAYYQCPMLCSLVLNATLDVLKKVSQQAGSDYRVLVVSFDPRDTAQVAHDKRASYLESLGQALPPASFEFATGSDAQVSRLAAAVGFRYRWDDEEQQYAHAAGMFIVTPKGKLSQTLTGIQFAPDEVSAGLTEAKKGSFSPPLKSVLLYCFQYNPKTGKYVLAAGRAMQVGAAVTVAGLAFLLFWLSRASRRRHHLSSTEGEDDEQHNARTTGLP